MTFLYRMMAMLAVLAPLVAATAHAQAPERRFALVVGNSEYRAGRLPTASNDAGLIAETLRTAGFDVAGARDLDQDTLRRSIREFLDKVSAAGPQAVSFIYLAGYGLQFEGENYIVPIDATIARDEDIPIEAIRISDFARPLSGTPGGVKLIVVDAARQHPYTPAGAPLASGLALVEPDPGMLIAFNTAPGSVAPVENGPYGAFAQALAEMIGTGGLGLNDVFARLRLRVNETTNGVAVPWYASKITQPFLFTEPTPDAPIPPQQVASSMQLQSQPIQQFPSDQEAYIAALERDTIAGYEEFTAAFPDSPHVRRVRALIAVRREAIMWRRVLSIDTREGYWSYLERYPQGGHVADAERRLARLAAAYDPPPAFVPMAFADIPPPPPDEVVYLNQPEVVFDDPVFVPPPPVPAFFCPPPPPEFVALPPPPPPIGAFFLPVPVVPFFVGPRPWVRPPSFVVAPPRPPIQQITINNTTIINERHGGGVGLLSPTLPGAVVTRVNSGALHVPPPAPPAPVRPVHNAVLQHPGVGVLGTTVALPPRVHTATVPGGGGLAPGELHRPPLTPGAPQAPVVPGGVRPPVPNTAATTPGAPHVPVVPGVQHPPVPNAAVTTPSVPHVPAPPGGPHPVPNTAATMPGAPPPPALPPAVHTPGGPPAATTPGVAPPHVAAPSPPPHAVIPPPPPVHAAPPPPQITRPVPPPPQITRPAPPPPQITRPAPPPPQIARPAPPPPQITRPAPPPPQIARPAPPPPQIARPAPPPPQISRPAPPPPQIARPAPPPPQVARPAAPQRCVVENGKQVCR
jgi:uncharacterized caspase-like protein